MEEVVDTVEAGKNNWNRYEVGLREDNIFVRDDSGYVDFTEKEIDRLVEAIDKARRRLREIKRQPTKQE